MAEDGDSAGYRPESREATPDYTFESTAQHLGIPEQNWGNESVREFVGFFNRVQQLQQDISEAKTVHLRRSSVGHLFDTPTEELQQEKQEVAGMTPPLTDRYSRSELMMRVAMELLRDGFKGHPAQPNYIKSKLNAVINSFGLEVTDIPTREPRDHNDTTKAIPPNVS
jgi:hypothetical protein